MPLLREPHHDGSPLYLDNATPALDETVTVRLRVSGEDPARRVWVRTTYDAEPTFAQCRARHTDDGEVWWEGALLVHNPVTHYRFLLEDADGGQRWVHAAGTVAYDVPDAFDFTITTHPAAPAWTRNTVVYQIFPDRFARSAAADGRATPAWAKPQPWDSRPSYESDDERTWLELYGGDLDGIVDHLDHIETVGGTTVYLTPVFPAESNHRYNASTFEEIDPLLGGDKAYARLSAAVHERGWHLLGDLTANHTGDTHEWFRQARAGGATRDWYCWRPDGGYECWMGHLTLPKLDHTNADMRRAMTEGPDSTVARWLEAPYSLDGWRIDVANMSGRLGAVDVNHDVARAVRRTAESVNPQAWVIGEHNHDAAGDIDGDGWHGTMNYSGFSWPIWSWLRAADTPARPFGRPVAVPRRGGEAVVRELREWAARYGWRATQQSWNILSSHDSARIRTVVGDPAVHRVAAGLQFTLPGVPMVFAGDEIGLEGILGEDGRRSMPWDHREDWDTTTLETYRALARLRREHPALIEGSLRWAYADDDALAFLREHPAGTLLVVARRTPGPDPLAGQPGLGGEVLLSTGPTDQPWLQIRAESAQRGPG
jgi:alpha-glucosidase